MSALPGSASTQSVESTTSAALPSGATDTAPHPMARKNADNTSFIWAASTSSGRDRKSTRLNSSHGYISYAVFCLKKKNIAIRPHSDLTYRVACTLRFDDR